MHCSDTKYCISMWPTIMDYCWPISTHCSSKFECQSWVAFTNVRRAMWTLLSCTTLLIKVWTVQSRSRDVDYCIYITHPSWAARMWENSCMQFSLDHLSDKMVDNDECQVIYMLTDELKVVYQLPGHNTMQCKNPRTHCLYTTRSVLLLQGLERLYCMYSYPSLPLTTASLPPQTQSSSSRSTCHCLALTAPPTSWSGTPTPGHPSKFGAWAESSLVPRHMWTSPRTYT